MDGGRRGALATAGLLAALLGLVLLLREPDAAPARAPAQQAWAATVRSPPVRAPVASSPPASEAAPASPASAAAVASAAPGAAEVATATSSGLLLRDGVPGPGRVVATHLESGAVVALEADAAGRFDPGQLRSGWWRLAPAVAGDSIAGGSFAPGEQPVVNDWFAALLLPWGEAGEGEPDAGDLEAVLDHLPPGEAPWLALARPALVAGRVVHHLTGAPVPGARVDLVADDGTQLEALTADPEGRFAVTLPRHRLGGTTARATAPGLACDAASAWSEEREVALRLRPNGLTLLGLVVDPSGAPVQTKVVVSVVDTALRFVAASGLDGRFRVEGLPPGVNRLGPRCVAVQVHARGRSGQARLSVALGPASAPVRLVLHEPTPLQVAAEDEDGRPLAAWCNVTPLPGPDDGQPEANAGASPFVWRGGHPGLLVDVVVRAEGRAPERRLVQLPAGPLRVQLRPAPRAVRCVVVDADGRPRERTAVAVLWSVPPGPSSPPSGRGGVVTAPAVSDFQEGETDAAGAFVARLPDGVTTVTVELTRDRTEKHERVQVQPELRFVLDASPPVAARFRPVDATTGAQLEGSVWVTPVARGGSIQTRPSSDGRRIARLRGPGSFRIGATGHVSSAPFDVGRVDLDLGDVRLAPGGAVELVVRGWPAVPVRSLQARWRDPDGWGRADQADAVEAPWLLDGLAPGRTTIEVEARGTDKAVVRAARVEVEVRAGATTTAVVDLGGD